MTFIHTLRRRRRHHVPSGPLPTTGGWYIYYIYNIIYYNSGNWIVVYASLASVRRIFTDQYVRHVQPVYRETGEQTFWFDSGSTMSKLPLSATDTFCAADFQVRVVGETSVVRPSLSLLLLYIRPTFLPSVNRFKLL